MNPSNANRTLTRISYNERQGTISSDVQNRHAQSLRSKKNSINIISGEHQIPADYSLKGNIENHIGYAQVPIGLAGPLKISDLGSEIHVPLSTTEGALVASYSRGMKAMTLSGGVNAVCLGQEVQRCPLFKFDSVVEGIRFARWAEANLHYFQSLVMETSNYASLIEVKPHIEANTVTLKCCYTCGDAAGQNMVTIATEHICQHIIKQSPVSIHRWYIEGNSAGDKKITQLALASGRGRKVIVESLIKQDIIHSVLKSSAEHIYQYWIESNLSMMQTGAIGNHGHIANGLTAIYMACGQDVASVVESSVGILRMELRGDADLYIALTLPSLIVGTVGGGTHLPTQQEALSLIGCLGSGRAERFAKICGATALAGELSIAAAIAEGHFTQAHQNLGRK